MAKRNSSRAARARRDARADMRRYNEMSRSLPQDREPSIGRGTFAVARANREARADLGHLIYVPKNERPTQTATEVPGISVARSPLAIPARKRSVKPEVPNSPELNLREKVTECHARPRSGRGSGGSRPFAGRYCK